MNDAEKNAEFARIRQVLLAEAQKTAETCQPLPADMPRFGSFAEDNPEAHQALADPATSSD